MSRRADLKKPVAAYWMVGLFALAGLSQTKVQVGDRAKTIERAKQTGRFARTAIEHARRGSILASDGMPLAKDEDTYEFGVIFRDVPHSDGFFMALSEATSIPAGEFAQLARTGIARRFWRTPMSADQAEAARRVMAEWRASGISLRRTGTRSYPLGAAAAGITGRMTDGGPTLGLESSRHEVLAGRDGKTVGLIDRSGAFLPMRLDGQSTRRVDGQDIVLTIDSHLQEVAAAALKEAVEANLAESGSAVVIEPSTGDILAMANFPTFDPSPFAATLAGDRRGTDVNPCYMSRLEPGSTFKILTLAKAFDDGKASATETFRCNGAMIVGSRTIHCALHSGGRAHGVIDPQAAIAKSCNLNAAAWAKRIGRDSFIRFIEGLGLLRPTQLGFTGEIRGDLNRDDHAKDLQLSNLGFGQALTATPVALASAFSLIGNHGVRMEARLIQRIGSRSIAPRSAGRMVRPEAAARVLKFMEAVFEDEHGTGRSLRIPGYRLAGKTGTAQRIGRGEGYVANFVGFVPAEKPRALVLVMIDHPQAGAYYGGAVAGPVFVKLANALISRFHIPPTEARTAR